MGLVKEVLVWFWFGFSRWFFFLSAFILPSPQAREAMLGNANQELNANGDRFQAGHISCNSVSSTNCPLLKAYKDL